MRSQREMRGWADGILILLLLVSLLICLLVEMDFCARQRMAEVKLGEGEVRNRKICDL